MPRVRLLSHSYERYQTPGDRRSLVTLRPGDRFEADGPELERLYELGAVEALLTCAGAAETAGVRVETIRRAVRGGSLTAVRVGRALHIAPTDLSAWLSARAEGAGR